ncbi:MAG TPA: hypothetical protein VF587_13495, partial [Solirubrobacteraceae bacterium]
MVGKLLLVLLLLAGFFCEEAVRPHAENHPWRIAIAWSVVAVVGAAGTWLLSAHGVAVVGAILLGG